MITTDRFPADRAFIEQWRTGVQAFGPVQCSRERRDAPIRFLRTVFEPTDWVAVFLKSYESGAVAQRVAALATVQTERFQRWLCAMNAERYNVFVT